MAWRARRLAMRWVGGVLRRPLDSHGKGLEVGHAGHAPDALARQFLLNVLEAFALRLGHAEDDEEESHQAHAGEHPVAVVLAYAGHDALEGERDDEGARPVEGGG